MYGLSAGSSRGGGSTAMGFGKYLGQERKVIVIL